MRIQGVAQLVERRRAEPEVAGSNPVRPDLNSESGAVW